MTTPSHHLVGARQQRLRELDIELPNPGGSGERGARKAKWSARPAWSGAIQLQKQGCFLLSAQKQLFKVCRSI
jgi:hypothetical protein